MSYFTYFFRVFKTFFLITVLFHILFFTSGLLVRITFFSKKEALLEVGEYLHFREISRMCHLKDGALKLLMDIMIQNSNPKGTTMSSTCHAMTLLIGLLPEEYLPINLLLLFAKLWCFLFLTKQSALKDNFMPFHSMQYVGLIEKRVCDTYLAYILVIRSGIFLQQEKLVPHPASFLTVQNFPIISYSMISESWGLVFCSPSKHHCCQAGM